jgi:hypothetical protein
MRKVFHILLFKYSDPYDWILCVAAWLMVMVGIVITANIMILIYLFNKYYSS